MSGWQWHVCDVCRLIDGDMSTKVCFYCGGCDAWICDEDANKLGRRAHAAALRAQEKVRGWM